MPIYKRLRSAIPRPRQPASADHAPCYVRAAVPGRDAILRSTTAALAAAALALAGCGGGERSDADDEEGTFEVELVAAEFPAQQHLADETDFLVTVRNVSGKTIPNLSATVESSNDGMRAAAFSRDDDGVGLASRSRPVWIVDESPGATAYGDTFALGPVGPGREGRFLWRVAATRAGRFRLTYRLSGSLGGGARIVRAGDGEPVRGSFDVVVDRRPAQARVTEDGEVERVPASAAGRDRAAGRDGAGASDASG